MPAKPPKQDDKNKAGERLGTGDPIDVDIQKKLLEIEKARADKAKKLAAEIAKNAPAHSSGSGVGQSQKGEQSKEDPALAILKNMCGILKNGFNRLGSDMKCYNTTISTGLKEMKSSFENTLEQMCYEEEDELFNDMETDPTEVELGEGNSSDVGSEQVVDLEGDKDIGKENTSTEATHTPTENISIFSKMRKKLVVPTNVGPQVDADLATFMNFIAKEPMRTDEFLTIKKTILRLENCTELQVPSIPEPVWKTIGGNAQASHKYLQRIHGDMLTFVYSLVYVYGNTQTVWLYPPNRIN